MPSVLRSEPFLGASRLTIASWNHDDLHNRYILTDRGGILIGEGLDQANQNSNRIDDVMTLL
jgi:hypothetical protein